MPRLGCLALLVFLFLAAALPLVFVGVFNAALQKLHVTPQAATWLVTAIIAGGLVNIPVARLARRELVPADRAALFGLGGLWPRLVYQRRETIVAVNVGGCVIPSALAAYEVWHLLATDAAAVMAVLVAGSATTAVCYLLARPVPGVGIVMPGLVPPIAAAAMALVLAPPGAATPVAFVAGIVGPVVGADLLHLRDAARGPSAIVSIGGAGTFDGIVLSGIVAAYLA